MEDVLGYQDRRVIVTGAGSGMGAAAARLLVELGAEVHGFDIRGEDTGFRLHLVDLRVPDQIDGALEDVGPVNALFNCAGLPNSADPLDLVLVGFCGHRHLTEKVVAQMAPGDAVAFIGSLAGIGWRNHLERLRALLATPDFAAARAWLDADEDYKSSGYSFAKEAINLYTLQRGFQLAAKGIRVNCINPGVTATPMLPHLIEAAGEEYFERFPRPIGRNAEPDEQAWPLVFLNSPRASYIAGVNLAVDGAVTAGFESGLLDPSVMDRG